MLDFYAQKLNGFKYHLDTMFLICNILATLKKTKTLSMNKCW